MKKQLEKALKSILTISLCLIVAVGSVPLSGFVGLELPKLSEINFSFLKASAATKVLDNRKYKFSIADEQKLTVNFAGVVDVSTINGSGFYVPETIYYNEKSYSVVSISSDALKGTSITSVVIPDTVTSIGDSAFANCTGLTEITIPENVTSVGDNAFENCTSLNKVNWNATKCSSSGNSSWPIFEGCKSLGTIVFGKTVNKVPNYVCYGVTSLNTVTFEGNVTAIGTSSFVKCSNIAEIDISKVTTIGNDAFNGCIGLSSVEFSNSLTSIGDSAFANCTGLTEITIPENVTSVGDNAFENCTSLNKVNWNATKCSSSGNSSWPIFEGCKSLGTIVFGETVNKVPKYVCYGITSLNTVTFADNVAEIGEYSFGKCAGLNKVNLPSSLTYMSTTAFSNVENLEYVIDSVDSNVCEYLINNEIGYTANIEDIYDSAEKKLDYTKTSYKVSEDTNTAKLEINYAFKETLEDKIIVSEISVKLPSQVSLVKATLDGEKISAKISKGILSFPVTKTSGLLVLEVTFGDLEYLMSYAKVNYTYENIETSERIDVINISENLLTVNVYNKTNIENITVSGVTAPNSYVDIYIDGMKITTVYSNASGTYSKEVLLENVSEGKKYNIKVSSGNNEVQKETVYSHTVNRHIMLVLDVMSGRDLYVTPLFGDPELIYSVESPIYELKKATRKFVDSAEEAFGENETVTYSLVTFSGKTSVIMEFEEDPTKVKKEIEKIEKSDGSDFQSMFETIEQQIGEINNTVDIIDVVVFTAGMPNDGEYLENGRYESCGWQNMDTKVGVHEYANAAYSQFDKIQNSCNVYTIAYFKNLEGAAVENKRANALIDFCKNFTKDIQNSGYIEIADEADLSAAYNVILNFIQGATTFTYSDSTRNYTSYCFYSDEYFQRENLSKDSESPSPYWYDGATDYYNPQLATMSLALAMSAYANPKAQLSENEEEQTYNQYDNVEKLLTDIGFENITYNSDFKNIAGTDTIGDIIALKKVDTNNDMKPDETIIAIAIRGGNYKMEWAGNFNVGEDGYHEGFKLARNRVLLDLNEYIKSNKDEITGTVKLWITGYSRAGATANLVGAALDDLCAYKEVEGFEGSFDFVVSDVIETNNPKPILTHDNIFVYCFEPPAGGLKTHINSSKSDYSNIYCIVNPADLVPFVAPAQFGFGRYGITKYIPTSVSSSKYSEGKSNMLEFFGSLPSYTDYLVDDFTLYLDNDEFYLLDLLGTQTDYSNFLERDNYKLDELTKGDYSQHVFLSEMIRQISTDVFENDENGSGRKVYYEEYQNEVIEVVKILNTMTETQKIAFVKSLIENFVSNKSDDIIEGYAVKIVESYLYAIPYVGEIAAAIEIIELLSKMYIAVYSQSLEIYGASETLYEYLSTALDKAIQSDTAGLREYNNGHIESLCKLIDTIVFKLKNSYVYLISLIPNFGSVAQAHYADLTFSWLVSMDESYYRDDTVLNNGAYRALQVNCDVNVDVYDSNDVLVASIVNGKVVENESSIIAIVNQDGEKEILLPPDEEYRVEIVGNIDNETVNCNIKEYCAEVNDYTRIITYADMPLDKGEGITITLPKYSEEEQNVQNTDGTSCDYKAVDDDGKKISVSQEFKGEEAIEAYYSVIAESSNEEIGAVFGSGSRNYGDFAQLEAIEINGSTFLGWYDENDKLISSEKAFRFMVTEDVKLIGRFSNKRAVTWNVDGTTSSLEYEYGEKIILPQEPQKFGYTFSGWTPAVPETMPAEDLTFTATWSANSYNAVFDANGGLWPDGSTEKVVATAFESQIIAPESPTKQGYVFSKWTPDVGVMDSVDGKTFIAEWIPAADTRYTVETYTMNTEKEYEKSTQVFSGITGETATAESIVPSGFSINSAKSVLNGTIAADNSLVLKIYLDRNTYTFTTVVDGVSTETEYYYGSTISELVEPEKAGYKFVGWDKVIPSTMPAENVTVTAKFEMIASVKIKNNTGSKSVNYGEVLRLTAIVNNKPADANIVWYVDGVKQGEGETFNVSFESGTKTVEVKLVDSNGNVLKDSSGNEIKDTEKVSVNSSFWQKIVSFFKNLFGMNRTIVQTIFKNVF